MTPSDSRVPFAFWVDPQSAFQVRYSLPVFHEIDFQVNEGFRQIPHGGVEVGGVLYGRVENTFLSVEAFRPIECEHAAGPSFQLSDGDVVKLGKSILNASKEDDLQGLLPLGWFIAHTRSPLAMTDREVQLFDQFFPEPGRLTVLIKPERFKPTRFSFLLRSASGLMSRDGTQHSVILPLPGRAGKSTDEPVPSIAAPVVLEMPSPNAAPAVPLASPRAEPMRPDLAKSAKPFPATPPADLLPKRLVPELPLPSAPGTGGRELIPPAPVWSSPSAGSLAEVTAPDGLPRAEPPSIEPVTGTPPVPASPLNEPIGSAIDPSLPAEVIFQSAGKESRTASWMIPTLLLASLLGCGIGYWAYIQLPPPLIELRVKRRPADLLVWWNPAQTRGTTYSVIRVNDSDPVLLSADQKTTGIAAVPLRSSNVKVEIVSQHWGRESRGIIRFLRAPDASVPLLQNSGKLLPQAGR